MKKIEYNEDGTIIVDGKKYVPESKPLKVYYEKQTSIVGRNDQMIKVLLTFRFSPMDASEAQIREAQMDLEKYFDDLMTNEFDVI